MNGAISTSNFTADTLFPKNEVGAVLVVANDTIRSNQTIILQNVTMAGGHQSKEEESSHAANKVEIPPSQVPSNIIVNGTDNTTTVTVPNETNTNVVPICLHCDTNQTNQPTVSSPPVTKKLYVCGFRHDALAREIFPDYSWGGVLYSRYNPTSKDVLFVGKFGPCHYDMRYFPGKVLYLNGEHLNDTLSLPNHYRIGPAADDGNYSMRLYFAAAALVGKYPPEVWANLTNPARRPQSTMEERAVLYVNGNCVPFRQQAAEEISKVIPIVFGGYCKVHSVLSARRGKVDRRFHKTRWWDNPRLFSSFQFCLVMENTNQAGYITEKILNAFLSGCLPIYYGTTEVMDLFHPDSFVYYDIHNPQPALQLLEQLYMNETAYQQRMHHPILRNGNETMESYFSITDKLGGGKLKRRIRQMMGLEG